MYCSLAHQFGPGESVRTPLHQPFGKFHIALQLSLVLANLIVSAVDVDDHQFAPVVPLPFPRGCLRRSCAQRPRLHRQRVPWLPLLHCITSANRPGRSGADPPDRSPCPGLPLWLLPSGIRLPTRKRPAPPRCAPGWRTWPMLSANSTRRPSATRANLLSTGSIPSSRNKLDGSMVLVAPVSTNAETVVPASAKRLPTHRSTLNVPMPPAFLQCSANWILP